MVERGVGLEAVIVIARAREEAAPPGRQGALVMLLLIVVVMLLVCLIHVECCDCARRVKGLWGESGSSTSQRNVTLSVSSSRLFSAEVRRFKRATSASHAPPCSPPLDSACAYACLDFSSLPILTDDLVELSNVYESLGRFSIKSSLVALPPEEKLSNDGSCVRIGGIAEYDEREADGGSAVLLLDPRENAE